MVWKFCACARIRQNVVVVLELGLPLQERDAGLVGADGEIAEVIAVADARDVGVEAQPGRKVGLVGDVQEGAVVVIVDRIVRQEILLDLAARVGRQEAEFPAELHAAPRQHAGRQRRVVVGRNIEVVRHVQLVAVVAGMPEARKQQAALARVAHRKGDIGRIEDRHVLEPHDHVVSDALLGVGVELDRGCLQHPVLVARRTARVARLLQAHRAVGMHLELLGEAAAVAIEDVKICLVEIGASEHIVSAGVAGDAELRILEVHRSLDRHLAGLLIVGDAVRGDRAQVLMDLHVSGQDGEPVGVERRSVTVDANAVVVVRDDRGSGSVLALRRRRAHVGGANRRRRDHAARGSQGSHQRCGPMKSYGQSSIALVGILAMPHLRWSEWSSMGVPDASDSRLALLTRWVTEDLGFAAGRIEPASADASFRRYFRLTRGTDSYIVMDAPPEKEPLEPFVGVARALLGMGLNVPVVLARDTRRGLLLLSDLGTSQYLAG